MYNVTSLYFQFIWWRRLLITSWWQPVFPLCYYYSAQYYSTQYICLLEKKWDISLRPRGHRNKTRFMLLYYSYSRPVRETREVTAIHNRTSRMNCRRRVSTAALRRLYCRQSSLPSQDAKVDLKPLIISVIPLYSFLETINLFYYYYFFFNW